jgi:SAM-dependent methyltransferase
MSAGAPLVHARDRSPGEEAIVEEVRRFYEDPREERDRPRRARRYYHRYLTRVLKTRIPPGLRVLDIGCGGGELLAALEPARGVGIDLSPTAVAAARKAHAGRPLEFVAGDGTDPEVLAAAGGPFDVILMVNVVTHLADVQGALEALHRVSHSRTRVFLYSYSRLWQPLLRAAELLRLRRRAPPEAWLPPEEVQSLLRLADFEVVREDAQVVWPLPVPILADLVNRWPGHLPVVDWLSLMYGLVARPVPARTDAARPPSATVVIPCRNESGHVQELVRRLPRLAAGSEFVFVEGHSTDDTEEAIRRAIAAHPDRPLRLVKQPGRGKGDAVRAGFEGARGDVLVILDADMGVAPEEVPKFVDVVARGKGEMVNGSRLVYPMEDRAMRFLNLVANKLFALLFSWLLGQQVRDTLCGTKVLRREDYERIAANRSYFGDFDPFGDFDLLFGASRLNLRIVDVPVRYHERTYGTTNISRFRHGWLLLRMSAFAARKLKFL